METEMSQALLPALTCMCLWVSGILRALSKSRELVIAD